MTWVSYSPRPLEVLKQIGFSTHVAWRQLERVEHSMLIREPFAFLGAGGILLDFLLFLLDACWGTWDDVGCGM